MMAVVPKVMVLYTNDAVDVHYNDGSRLQLSPCGSSMYHYDSPSSNPQHPLARVQGVQKWTQFVTSSHKSKVIQALDFRNRFACRPFLSSTLIPPDDVMSLHAKIDQIAWGRTMEECDVEVFRDGSRRVVSVDEYASLILSPHGQDFTVCYLSHISADARDSDASLHYLQESGSDKCNTDLPSDVSADQIRPESDREQHRAKSVGTGENRNEIRFSNFMNLHINDVNGNGNFNNNSPNSDTPVPVESTMDASGLTDGHVLSHNSTSLQGKFHTSAITAEHDISSISRVSTPDGLRKMIDCDDTLTLHDDTAENPQSHTKDVLHSSPVSIAGTQSRRENTSKGMTEQPELSDCQKTSHMMRDVVGESSLPMVTESSIQQAVMNKPTVSSESHENKSSCKMEKPVITSLSERSNSGQVSAKDSLAGNFGVPDHPRNAQQQLSSSKNSGGQKHTTPLQPVHQDSHVCVSQQGIEPAKRKSSRKHHSGFAGHRAETWSATRNHYTWVTQHISCNNCPAAWRHALRILQKTDPADSLLVSECNLTVSTNVAKGLHRNGTVDTDNCASFPVTSPLPLNCPFQHMHSWLSPYDDDRQESDNITEFMQGQLKVIMMEGIVYRFVDVGGLKVVEIYPGDGSVFVSQGISAHYFSHLMWEDGKLKETTYSIKMLPISQPTSGYSIPNILKRGHRLLNGFTLQSKFTNQEELPCWRLQPVRLVEPLTASLLEECAVPGYGRFTAYANGRIRVVFDDRTTLDMVADFSQRLQGCMEHSDIPENHTGESFASVKVTCFDGQLNRHQCRLMLPTGKYLAVDVHKPGVYKRYIDAAKEWINWVQSSPKERLHFYQNKGAAQKVHWSAEAELKKIECFNYIVAHAGITSSSVSQGAGTVPVSSQPSPTDSHPAFINSWSASSNQHLSAGEDSHRSTSAAYSSSGYSTDHPHWTNGVDFPHRSSGPKDKELMQGFNSVREALLRTSKMIKDIDDIVKDHKNTAHTML